MKRIKIICAVFLSFIILGSVYVYGENLVKTIQVTYRNITIQVNGKQISSEQEPFIYQGRTFVPFRTIGEAVNKTVEWDNAKNQVLINDLPSKNTNQMIRVSTYPIGENVVQGKFIVCVNGSKIITRGSLKVLIVDCSLENKDEKDQVFVAGWFSVFDDLGNRYLYHSDFMVYDSPFYRIHAGEKIRGEIPFLIPDIDQKKSFKLCFDKDNNFFIVPLDY